MIALRWHWSKPIRSKRLSTRQSRRLPTIAPRPSTKDRSAPPIPKRDSPTVPPSEPSPSVKFSPKTAPEVAYLNRKHQKNIEASYRILQDLRNLQLSSDEELRIILGSLRKCNPYQFEELLLHCFEEFGWNIKRNSRYSGDGGIDGLVFKDGMLFFVQAKRYKEHIKPQDVEAFSDLLLRHQDKVKGGFFIHTGKTGDKSRAHSRNSDRRIIIVSGSKLVQFVLGRGEPWGSLLPKKNV